MSDKSERTYPLTYKVSPEKPPVTVSEIDARKDPDVGACDAVIIFSMIYPEDGSFSLKMVSLDGRTDSDISSHDLFKVWNLMAKALSEDERLGHTRRVIAKAAFESVRELMLAGRKKREVPS